MKIELLPAFSDNYIFLLTAKDGTIAVVDPGDPAPVIETLDARGQKLDFILNTHHHSDHVGGNLALQKRYGCEIIGAADDARRIPGITKMVKEGDTIDIGNSPAKIIETHGHTRGHISYYFPAEKALFCGDTVFSLGCGRLFEGTPEQMWESFGKIMALPDDTQIYCAHEYTLDNAGFCKLIEPDNPDLLTRIEEAEKLRCKGLPTIPVSLATEKKTNCFLRAGSAERFGFLRHKKDTEYD